MNEGLHIKTHGGKKPSESTLIIEGKFLGFFEQNLSLGIQAPSENGNGT